MLARTRLLLVFCIVLSGSVSGFGQDNADAVIQQSQRSDDSKLIEGLRRRRLFDLAEFYCRRQLSRSELDPTSQSMIVIELMKTQTAAAILSEPDDRDEAWQKIQATSAQFDQEDPNHPRRFLVRVQQALSHLSHGRLLQQELAAEMADEGARDKALEEIRTARSLLVDLQHEITKAVPDQRGRSLSEHDLTVEQLLNLNNNVRYQLAVCNLNRAQLYDPSDRLNRVDALNGVKERLDEVQRATSQGQPLWWKTKLGQIECLRLLGNPAKARALAASILTEDVPASTMLQLLEQMIRLAIDIGDETFSRDLLVKVEELGSRTAQLDLALVELAVDLSARSSTDQRKREWLTHASESSRLIEKTHGAYWGRRADLVLIGASGAATGRPGNNDPIKLTPRQGPLDSVRNTELDIVVRLAEDAFRKQRWDDALKAYDRASALAVASGDPATALQLEVRAGQVLEKQGKHELAGQRLIVAAHRDPAMKLAPAVHLRGCWNVARTVVSDRPERSNEFKGYLEDHLRTWGSDPTANQVRVWLGHQFQLKQQWQTAFDIYYKVTSDSPHFPDAVERMLFCARQKLRSQRESQQWPQLPTVNLVSRLGQLQASLDASDPVAMKLELAQAELDLVFGSRQPGNVQIDKIKTIQQTEPGLQNSARAIMVVLYCFEMPDRANELLAAIAQDATALDVCDRCLSGVIANPESTDGIEKAWETRLSVIEYALKLPEIAEPAGGQLRTNWLLRKSEALAATHRHAESIVVLAELEKQFPRSARIQMQLARAMTEEFGKTNPDKPLAKWRQVASRLKSHTPNWYESKYEVARLLLESGHYTEAAKLLKYIQAIPPGWEQSDYKQRFEALLKACQSAN